MADGKCPQIPMETSSVNVVKEGMIYKRGKNRNSNCINYLAYFMILLVFISMWMWTHVMMNDEWIITL